MRNKIRRMVMGYFEPDAIRTHAEWIMSELNEEGYDFAFDDISYNEEDINRIVDAITDSILRNLQNI